MEYWRLQIKRPLGVEEIIDLNSVPAVWVGDDSANDVCLHTTQVPSRLKMLRTRWGQPILRLTEETEKSLEGPFQKSSAWKTKLYRGHEFKATGDLSWEVDGTVFRLYKCQKLGLSKYVSEREPLARKHLFQALATSIGSHLTIFLLFALASLITGLLNRSSDELEVEKVSIAQVKEIFQPPEPQKIPTQAAEKEMAPAPKEGPPQSVGSQAKQARPSPQKAAAQNPRSSARSEAESKGKSVENMGLLAIQSSATSTSRNLNLKSSGSSPQGTSLADRNFNPTGSGIHSGRQNFQVAQIDGFSGGSYQSGQLGQQVAAATGPAIRLVRKEIEIRGGLDKGIVRSIVEERLPELQYCYENALLKDQSYGGKMLASWTIQPDGSVTELGSESSDMKQSDFHECIQSRIAKWKFPSPKGGGIVNVKYPFVFSSLGS